MDGMPLMASTKMRTGRRNFDRLSLRKNRRRRAQGKRDQQGEPHLLDRPDDGVQSAAGRGRLGRGDTPLVVEEEARPEGREPLDEDVGDQPDKGDEHDHHGAGHGDRDGPVDGRQTVPPGRRWRRSRWPGTRGRPRSRTAPPDAVGEDREDEPAEADRADGGGGGDEEVHRRAGSSAGGAGAGGTALGDGCPAGAAGRPSSSEAWSVRGGSTTDRHRSTPAPDRLRDDDGRGDQVGGQGEANRTSPAAMRPETVNGSLPARWAMKPAMVAPPFSRMWSSR